MPGGDRKTKYETGYEMSVSDPTFRVDETCGWHFLFNV